MAKHPAVGDEAPAFELEGTHGAFKLSDHRGEKVLLLFYPGDETTVCTKQFCSYRDNAEAFGALGVTAVGISGKDLGSKRQFTEKNDLSVALLADPDFEVAKDYDAYSGLSKMAKRSAIIIDEQGIVAHRHDHAIGLDFQTVADLKKTLDELPAAAYRRGSGRAHDPVALQRPARVGQRRIHQRRHRPGAGMDRGGGVAARASAAGRGAGAARGGRRLLPAAARRDAARCRAAPGRARHGGARVGHTGRGGRSHGPGL